MPLSTNELSQLVSSPTESLNLEMKAWIDITNETAIAKIFKGVSAIRNNDGGYLLIGFNDDSTIDVSNHPGDVKSKFHIDVVQGIISKYCSEPFEVFVHYPVIEGLEYVVIEVPQGVKTPIATKKDLFHNSNQLLKANAVYARTLNANNTASTAEAIWKDWPNLINTCFENRDADLGRFVRRHLLSTSSKELAKIFDSISSSGGENESSDELLNFLTKSRKRIVSKSSETSLPAHGFMEVAIQVLGEINKHTADQNFLNLLMSSNPKLSGWPVWTDIRGSNQRNHPYFWDDTWEAFIKSLDENGKGYLDFWKLSPDGFFYLYRALQDDITKYGQAPKPGTVLDFALVILRSAECVLVAIEFAKALGAKDDAVLKIAFRWTGLRGRILDSWANPDRFLDYERTSQQDSVCHVYQLDVSTSSSAIPAFINKVANDVFKLFEGFEITNEVTEDLVRRLIERRL